MMRITALLLVALGAWSIAAPAFPQVDPQVGPTIDEGLQRVAASVLPSDPSTADNPMAMLAAAARLLPSQDAGASPASQDAQGLSAAINIMILLSVLTLAPAIVLMTTSFVRILIVFGLLRQALGTQGLPPPQVITGLSLFMTLLVMSPTLERVYDEALGPYNRGEIREYDELWDASKQPLRDFMFDQIEATGNWSSLYMILNYRGIDTSDPQSLTRADVDMVALVPAFMLSELKTAFLMGFRVYLPFLVIDMVIAALLISMSMMMLPPVLISLPFKLLLFVLVDGWQLVTGGLLASFAQEGVSARLSAVSAAAADTAVNAGVPPG
ncbi:MAG: flagellar type III secretion system pore protein FliP [Planctomycetota bacterium]